MTLTAGSLSRRAMLGQTGRLAMAAPLLTLVGCNDLTGHTPREQLSGETMGTYYRITMSGRRGATDLARLRAGVERVLETVNDTMSTYRADSELSRFNTASQTAWIEVSQDLGHVVASALEISRRSSGAFDPTIAPLVNLWGFGPGKPVVTSPHHGRVGMTRARIGHHRLAHRAGPTAIRKNRPDVHVDLSGIGKGFAVDRVADYLARSGIEQFLVDIGGDMRAQRKSPDVAPWRLGIERPVIGLRTVHRMIDVGTGGVATSGDYRKFLDLDGSRYSHIIDPRTGAPVRHDLASVTVIAATTQDADAWSTALMVMGPRAGLRLAERTGLPAFFVIRGEKGLIDLPSAAFQRFLVG